MPPVRRRAHYQHVTQFERGRIIGMREAGLSYRAIAHRVGRNVATVLRCCHAWFEEGRHQRVRGTGPRRRTTDRQDRHLRFLALRDRFSTTREVANAWYHAVERPIAMSLIYRRIRSFGIRSYRPHLVLPLTPNHRRQRLAWCNERIAWDEQWNSVIFSDESRFCLGMHDGRRRMRRLRGERRNFAFSIERPVARTVGVMVWGAICFGSRSRLVFIQGNLTAIRYVQEVLRSVVVPYFRRVNNDLFQQDNARPHIANVSRDFLDDSQVDLLPWPPRSPDLSPIEHVWDLMGRRLTNLHNPPLTLAALRHEIQVGWDSVPQDEINHLIRSMPRRVRECIGSRGGPTHY
jgi:transposase